MVRGREREGMRERVCVCVRERERERERERGERDNYWVMIECREWKRDLFSFEFDDIHVKITFIHSGIGKYF